MFSKTERDYLSGKFTPNPQYKRILDHRISLKLKQFKMLELPLLEQSSVTKFRNNVAAFSNIERTRQDLKRRSNETEAKIGTKFFEFLDSLHSLDSANACGALGPRFKSGRAHFLCDHFEHTIMHYSFARLSYCVINEIC